MKFFTLSCLLLVGFSNAVLYKSDDRYAVISLGDKSAANVRLDVRFSSNEIYVFGPECAKADSCTTKYHDTFDPEKNTNKKLKDGTIESYKYVEYDDVTVSIGKGSTTHKVKVVNGLVKNGNKTDSATDGSLGLSLSDGDNSFILKLLGNDSSLLIIPRNPHKESGDGKLVINEEDEVACGKISLVETEKNGNKPTYQIQATATFEKDPIDVKVEFAYDGEIGFSDTIITKFYKADNINQKAYDELKDVKIVIGNETEVVIPKTLLFTQTKDNKDKYSKNFQKTLVDISLPSDVLDNYCVKIAKDGDVLKLGAGERKNSVGMVFASFGMVSFMLALLRL